jgi:pimeloyl-ACP methyl ester carboxylesterase
MTVRRAIALVIVVFIAAAALNRGVQLGAAALLLLPHFFPGAVPRPLRAIAPTPSVETIAVPGAPGRMVADIYWPGGDARRPVMILFLGVNPLPRSHEQVVTLADGIARTGVVAVVAESEALLAGEIRLEEVDNLVALFQHLEQQPRVDPTRIGFAGFCVGAVLELLAAGDERIADRVAYVNAFSVYANGLDVVRAVLARSMPGPGGPVPWEPSPLTREVFTRHVIALLPSPRDRALVTREVVERTALTSPELQLLTPLGRQVRELFVSDNPAAIDQAITELPPELTDRLSRISPARAVPRIRATTLLMHDQNDTYLPVSGARDLAATFPPGANVRYSEFRLFAHVVPDGVDDPALFVQEILKLVGHIHAVLVAADRGRGIPAPAMTP